jgi:hypothetical protein
VSLGRTADAAAITAAAVGGFDTVLLATGAITAPPLAVPGVRSVDPLAALADPDALGRSVAIFDELGGWEGVSLAEYLTARGARVRLISPLASWAGRVTVYSRLAIGARLAAAGMRTSVLRRPVRSDAGGLVLSDVLTGEEETVESVDTLVHVAAPAADDQLLSELADAGFHGEVRLLGDAYAPRSCLEAVYEGRLAGVLLGTDDPALALVLGARDPYRLAGAVHA